MASEETKQKSSKRKLPKKKVVLYSYIGILMVVAVLFGYNVLNYFYFDAVKVAGKPIYGYRTENLEPISDSIISNARELGENQLGVQEVTITVQGPVVYIDVRVNESVTLESAQEAAELVGEKLLSEAGTIMDDYAIQLVVCSGDVETLSETNRTEELEYYKEHRLDIVEQIVAHAEEYPTQSNIERAQNNINVMPKDYNSKTEKYEARYAEEQQAFQARIDALTPLTADEEEALGDIPYLEVDQTIMPSEISTYPSWGAYDKITETFEWQ